MENCFLKFPSLGKTILNLVEEETLVNFKEASRKTNFFLENERFYWIRILNHYNCLMRELRQLWRKVVSRTPTDLIKELAVAVFLFPQIMKMRYQNQTLSPLEFIQKIGINYWHPVYIVTFCGCSPHLCHHVVQRTGFNRPDLLWRIYDAQISLRYIPNHSSIDIVYYD